MLRAVSIIAPAGSGSTQPVYFGSRLWAQRPAAASATDAVIRFRDVGGGQAGTGGGTFMYSNGVRWKPIGEALLDAIDTPNSAVANTTEQQLNPNHVVIPAGLILDYDRLLINLSFGKAGTTDSSTLRLRFGPLGTTADPVIATITALAGTAQSYGADVAFKRMSATTLQKLGNADPSASFINTSNAAFPAVIAVSSMDSNAMYLSLTSQMTGGTEVATVQDYTLKLLAAEG